MRKRTLSREFALQILYQMDICRLNFQEAMENFSQAHEQDNLSDEVKSFTSELVQGTAENLGEIDKKISHYAANWELKRMAFIDRNILRLGSYELIFREDIPPKVAINEAVELAKKYSGPESAKFVNGILDKIKTEKDK